MTILGIPLTQEMLSFILHALIVLGLIPLTLLIGYGLSDLMNLITGGDDNP